MPHLTTKYTLTNFKNQIQTASPFFRAEGLRLRGVVQWPAAGKDHHMTPVHRARPLKTPPTEGRMASATILINAGRLRA